MNIFNNNVPGRESPDVRGRENLKVDFHVHTTVSDGYLTPDEALGCAERAGLDFFSIADHDAIAGYDAVAPKSREGGMRIVPAIEFSASHNGREIHILGYFRLDVPQEIRDLLKKIQKERVDRVNICIGNLNNLGVDISIEDVRDSFSGRSIGRSHVARALMKKGYVANFYEAFSRYLGPSQALVPGPETTSSAVIRLINEVGGVSIWAHPTIEYFDKNISDLVGLDLKGIEAYNPRLIGRDLFYVERVSIGFNLLLTAGSDWHGNAKPASLKGIAVPRGQICGFMDWIEG